MGYGPHWGWFGGYGWFGPFHMVIWLIALVVIVALVVWFFRPAAASRGPVERIERRSPGLDILEERYARGEINRDEYLQKKKDMTG
jgi:putative membrane protein